MPTVFVKSADIDISADNYIILEKLARDIEEVFKACSKVLTDVINEDFFTQK